MKLSDHSWATHDNGGRPFIVKIAGLAAGGDSWRPGEPRLEVRVYENKSDGPTPHPGALIFQCPVLKAFTDAGVDRNAYGEESVDGTSILCMLSETTYAFIGREVFLFQTEEEITEFISYAGLNDVIFAACRSASKTYFPSDDVQVDSNAWMSFVDGRERPKGQWPRGHEWWFGGLGLARGGFSDTPLTGKISIRRRWEILSDGATPGRSFAAGGFMGALMSLTSTRQATTNKASGLEATSGGSGAWDSPGAGILSDGATPGRSFAAGGFMGALMSLTSTRQATTKKAAIVLLEMTQWFLVGAELGALWHLVPMSRSPLVKQTVSGARQQKQQHREARSSGASQPDGTSTTRWESSNAFRHNGVGRPE